MALRALTKKGAARAKPYVVVEVPHCPTIEDMKWPSDVVMDDGDSGSANSSSPRLPSSERLAERGWGKPKQAVDVVMDDGETRGFQILYRRWPIGIDPLANQEQIIDGKGRVRPGRSDGAAD